MGSVPAKVRQLIAAEQAMSANCSELGVGITAQSEKIKTPFAPSLGFFVSIKKQEEAVFIPGRVPIIFKPARSTSAVVFKAPATIASALS